MRVIPIIRTVEKLNSYLQKGYDFSAPSDPHTLVSAAYYPSPPRIKVKVRFSGRVTKSWRPHRSFDIILQSEIPREKIVPKANSFALGEELSHAIDEVTQDFPLKNRTISTPRNKEYAALRLYEASKSRYHACAPSFSLDVSSIEAEEHMPQVQ